MSEQEKRPSAQKKRPRFSENAEGSRGKNSSSFLPATCSPEVPAMWPQEQEPWLRIGMAKPASTAPLTNPVAATAPSPEAMTPTPALETPSPKAIAEPEDGGMVEQGGGAMVAMVACESGHVVCCACGGGGNTHCSACGCAATYTALPHMDVLIGALELPCPYSKFGCGTSVAYHEHTEHKARCAHAPCYCLEFTPPFEGSPASLVRHLTEESGRHRWSAPETIEYGASHWFHVLASSEDQRRLLVAEDGRLFLLAVGAVRALDGVCPVTVVCIRGNAMPLYTGELRVEGPPDEGEIPAFTMYARVASCAVPGEVNMAKGQRLHAHVNPTMLHGESGEVHLRLCIVNGSRTLT
ncbi:unnamed protein product [Alopecurus aequalis]